ncbi:rhodanese-like domain-containing protein [uncultured Dokdonia sp.]|uniref:rhodanese-like domain-containing protein n=1 Tax=uncultured Dokdonia sp. TaxID=575653 RepID=UPI00261C20A5|nr:rhodanese-like domain-containing protein [uncultured Dokdonia sp.]
MKLIVIILFLISVPTWAQEPMDVVLNTYNDKTVPYISVEDLHQNKNEYLILDTRKKEEFTVSHIPTAIWSSEKLDSYAFAKAYPDKSQPIVVYCSIGVRSENFGESLQKLGYTKVYNLYGSIFAWKDKGYMVVNQKKNPTDSVHVYSKEWGKYLQTGIKIYK